MDTWYDETPVENQNLQLKYGLGGEFIDLNGNFNITPEERIICRYCPESPLYGVFRNFLSVGSLWKAAFY